MKFTNTLPFPLRLEATTEKTLLKLALKGSKRVPLQAIRRQTVQRNPQQVMVTVFQGKRPVSRDLYQL
ncbi:hypothetical protein ACE4Z6_27585, partial [Salmonella enterica]|uniref:hypothetical protein n=1 Tax=Salmonella enterica TaxID=28901 RepID=UPI003D2C7E48